jgi:hypothetical protein
MLKKAFRTPKHKTRMSMPHASSIVYETGGIGALACGAFFSILLVAGIF